MERGWCDIAANKEETEILDDFEETGRQHEQSLRIHQSIGFCSKERSYVV